MIRLLLSLLLLTGCVSKKLAGPGQQAPARNVLEAASGADEESLSYPQAKPLDESKPVKITADKLRYSEKAKTTRFSGNVRVTQESALLTADELITSNKEETGTASGSVQLSDKVRRIHVQTSRIDYANRLDEAKMSGGLQLISEDPYGRSVSVTADSGKLWTREGKAHLEGGVTAWRGSVSATARSADVNQEAGEIILNDKVRVQMGENRFRADKAQLQSEGQKLILEGDVRALFTPAQLEEAGRHPGETP